MSVIIISTNENITLNYKNENVIINKIKSPKIFEEVSEKILQTPPNVKWVEDNFSSIKQRIENITEGVMTIKNNVVVLKGTNIPVPDLILKKLKELDLNKESIEPLLRFWRKLSKNPNENSRRDLYGFMTKNNIPITETGDIVVEKGVNQKAGSYYGHLVDCKTKSIDNSVGSTVTMPREKVNSNSSQTCSYGLHVGAPDYVRNNWTSDVIVECVVDPMDVVSVPSDYNATKMRVCAYKVMGYSNKSRNTSKVVTLNDFLQEPLPEVAKVMQEKVESVPESENKSGAVNVDVVESKKTKVDKATKKETKAQVNLEQQLQGMSAKQIVNLVFEKTGEKITITLKSKKAIINKALKLLKIGDIKLDILKNNKVLAEMNNLSTEKLAKIEESSIKVTKSKIVKVINTKEMSKKELVNFLKEKFNENISISLSRSKIEQKVIEHATKAGYKIIK